MTLGVAPNFTFNPKAGEYQPPAWHTNNQPSVYTCTDWHAALEGAPAMSLDIALGELPPDANYSLVLSVGVRFGFTSNKGNVEEVKRSGAAKVLMVLGGRPSENIDLSKNANGPATEMMSRPVSDLLAPTHTELSLGKEAKLQPDLSYGHTVNGLYTSSEPPVVEMPLKTSPGKSSRPKKERTSPSLARPEAPRKNTLIYKESGRVEPSVSSYYWTMTTTTAVIPVVCYSAR